MKKIKLKELEYKTLYNSELYNINQLRNVTLSLEEEEGNLTDEKAKHLLRRITFGPTPVEVDIIKDRPISEVVDELLGDGLDYLPINEGRLPSSGQLTWVNTVEEDPSKVHVTIRGTIEGTHKARYAEFVDWWISHMSNDIINVKNSIVSERLTFFWHTHWCIEFTYDTQGYIPPPLIYRSNQTIRKYRLGNFKKFVEEMMLSNA